MASLTLSGVIKDPYGVPVVGAILRFEAVRSSDTVVKSLISEVETDENGDYSIDVEYGLYNIVVKTRGSYTKVATKVLIDSDVTATDLNELLVDWQGGAEVTPTIIIEMREILADARDARDAAQASEASASTDAASASADATTAEQARDAALAAGDIYDDTTAGLAATSDGDYFQVPGPDPEEFTTLYRNDTGSATEIVSNPSVAFVRDTERAAVEASTGGLCTIERTPNGQASYMFVIPKTNWEDLLPGQELGTGVHEAFLEGGVEKSELLVGMFQAANVNGELVSQPRRAPRNSINWDNSRTEAQASGFDIMSNWEWSAIAFWCMANGFQPRGNTGNGKSHSNPWEQGLNVEFDNIATGSGPNTWNHNNAANGIADLVGNVWEWQWGFKMVDGRIFLAPDNDKSLIESGWVDTGWDMPGDQTWASQDNTGATQDVQRALIVPNGAADPDGRLYTNLSGERLPVRGGTRTDGANAGLGALRLSVERAATFTSFGLRLSRLV